LSWGLKSRTYRRWLPTNGAKLVTGRRRRSNRVRAAARADVRLPRSRVFNAFDYELVRAELLARTGQRSWGPNRDAAMLDLQVRLRLAARGGAPRPLVAGALADREVAGRYPRARGDRRRTDR